MVRLAFNRRSLSYLLRRKLTSIPRSGAHFHTVLSHSWLPYQLHPQLNLISSSSTVYVHITFTHRAATMALISRRKPSDCMHRIYIDSRDSIPLGLGVIAPEQTILEGGSQLEPPLPRQNDDPQPASAIQEENMPYSIPGSRPQQTLTRTMLNTYALMRGRLERGGQGPLYQEGFTYNPWEPRPQDDNPKLSPKILWETL